MSDPIRPPTSRPVVSPAPSPPTNGTPPSAGSPSSAGAATQSASAARTRPATGTVALHPALHPAHTEAPLSAGAQQLVALAERSVRPRADALAPSPPDPNACKPAPLSQDPRAAQARIDQAVQDVGLHFRQQPHYGQTLSCGLAETGVDGNTVVSDAAFRSDALLRSTLIHEQVHQEQVATGNFAKFGRSAGNVNEIEAYRAELLPENLQKSQLGPNAQRQVTSHYLEHLDNLLLQGNVGFNYAKQVLLQDDFQLRSQDRLQPPIAPSPNVQTSESAKP